MTKPTPTETAPGAVYRGDDGRLYAVRYSEALKAFAVHTRPAGSDAWLESLSDAFRRHADPARVQEGLDRHARAHGLEQVAADDAPPTAAALDLAEAELDALREQATGPLTAEDLAAARRHGAGTMRLPLARISASALNPRKHFDEAALEQLADSIRTHGLLEPIVVRKRAHQQYEIIAGERRYRAAGRACGADAASTIQQHERARASYPAEWCLLPDMHFVARLTAQILAELGHPELLGTDALAVSEIDGVSRLCGADGAEASAIAFREAANNAWGAYWDCINKS
jgi:hypothetical protein